MKLREIIKNIDKSSENEDWVDFENLACELFDMHDWDFQITEQERSKLSCYWFFYWLCTDTTVGFRAYFFENEFVFYSYQSARKDYERFYWKDKKSYNKIREYFQHLRAKYQKLNEPDLYFCDMGEDYKHGFRINYTSELYKKHLDQEILYIPTNEKVNILESSLKRGNIISEEVNIINESGEVKTTNLKNLSFSWFTK